MMRNGIDKSARIHDLQVSLNKPDNLPKRAYRRDFNIYELVCYVNNITACYISGNYAPIERLSQRAREYIDRNDCSENREYYDIVLEYLKELDSLE
jgi:hypothetical protein